MAYILGFLFADGNIICNKRGSWFFSIQITDKDILYKMKTVMGSEHKISRRKKVKCCKSLYRLQIGSKEMCQDLIKLGLTERKSKKMILPSIPKVYFGDFLRGYFDGDGGVWVGYINKNRNKKTFAIMTYFTSGSLIFLNKLKEKLNYLAIRGGFVVKKERGYDLKFSMLDSLKISKIMYNSNSPLFLGRKRAKFDNYIKMRS
ncbi:MAG: hypothetical protein K9L98_00810 [Candidatus Pacebacteria bacterium]|nr:hypothetical protein [Candidatus Paceibacterota bacterium]MCF7862536.1 hypothetical protein [Candidatus Paceibacterota bacterium]